MINSFTGEHEFLSNFYTVTVPYDGINYPSSENAFQAQKAASDADKIKYTSCTPSKAKYYGRREHIDKALWDSNKDEIMYEIVKSKFIHNSHLVVCLLNTGDEELIEGNTWHDNYWGDCKCIRCRSIKGQNKLGKILMRIRSNF